MYVTVQNLTNFTLAINHHFPPIICSYNADQLQYPLLEGTITVPLQQQDAIHPA